MAHRKTQDDPPSDIETVDLAVTEKVSRRRHHPVMRFLGTLSEAADQPQLATLCVLTIVTGLARGKRRMAVTGAQMLAAHALATGIKSAIKHRVDRTRPHVAFETGRYEMCEGEKRDGDACSFPSGHTAGAVAVAGVVAVRYPNLAVPASGLAAAASILQVPRAKHYPTDLAAGALIGVVSAGLALGALSVLRRARR